MKKLFLILSVVVAIAIISCDNKEKEEPAATGCLTGVNPDGDRVLIRCCTRQQYLVGSNVAAGGTSSWGSYTQHQWEECDNCK